jgi:hypothetical protein
MTSNPVSRLILSSLMLLSFSNILFAQESLKPASNPDYPTANKYLFGLKTTGEVAEIKEKIMFSKDVADFNLLEGKLFLCSSYNKNHQALLFLGKGEFSFSPRTQIEKDQLYRFYETKIYKTKFIKLFLLFDDNTFNEITKKLDFSNAPTKSEDRELKDCVEYFEQSDNAYSRSDYLRSLMMENKTGFFFAHIKAPASGPVFFQINPFEDEAVTFMRSISAKSKKGVREIVCQFPVQQNTLTGYVISPVKQFLKLTSYKIESTINNSMDFSAKCIIDFNSKEQEQRWITFYLYNKLKVDSVKWEDGTSAEFVRSEDEYELWINCKSEFLDGDDHSLSIYYHGDLLHKNYELGWILLNSSNYWYPRYGDRSKSYFGLKFNCPSEYDLISIGDLVQSSESNGVRSTTWLSDKPVRNASFYIGKFEKFTIKEENLPEINVYISKYGHNQMRQWLNRLGIYSISDATEFIGFDVSNSAKLYTNLFGPPPVNSLSVTESPYFHGEAFPGLIHLSWATVIQTNFKGEDEIFRAHEVAHQWWGIAVDFDTYHDQWLSEGLSEYSGLWYLQAVKNDNDLFFDVLNKWKADILNVRKYIFGSGTESGPVWLGYRTHSSETSGDYYLVIYKKGAWIIHMLRAMLLDLNTMNEERMKQMMREFYNTYKDKAASTEDFKKIVDKHCGEDMRWFFDQYVYGTEIPVYRCAYRTEETGSGKHKIIIRIKQEDVSENFKMYLPVKFIFNDDTVARTRILVKGEETVFETPNLPSVPDKVIFNDLESVLCIVKNESW